MISLLINATEKTGPTIITAVIITIICISVLVLNFYVLKVSANLNLILKCIKAGFYSRGWRNTHVFPSQWSWF